MWTIPGSVLQVKRDNVVTGVLNGLTDIVPVVIAPGVRYLYFDGAETVNDAPLVGAGKDYAGDKGVLGQLNGNPRVVLTGGVNETTLLGKQTGVRVRLVPLAGGAGKGPARQAARQEQQRLLCCSEGSL